MYKRTTRVTVLLDGLAFMAARARYFTTIKKFRSDGSKIFWHDETWRTQYEEKPYVWTNGTTGIGRFR